MADNPISITGTINTIFDLETFPSGFTKRTLVIDTEDQYPQPIAIEFLKDKVNLMDGFTVGQKIMVHVNLRGKAHTPAGGETKFYNTIVGWKIDKVI